MLFYVTNMACIGVVNTIIPAPLVGTPEVLTFSVNEKKCTVHTNGPIEGCTLTGYKQGCCCGDDKVGFEVPILGYNTTPSVYAECDGGVIPSWGTTQTSLPPGHSTQTIGLPPQRTNTSHGTKKKVGVTLLFAALIVAIF